jgi:hypothetical protein
MPPTLLAVAWINRPDKVDKADWFGSTSVSIDSAGFGMPNEHHPEPTQRTKAGTIGVACRLNHYTREHLTTDLCKG